MLPHGRFQNMLSMLVFLPTVLVGYSLVLG